VGQTRLRHELKGLIMNVLPQRDSEEEINFGALIDTLFLERKLVVAITLAISLFGLGYAFISTPIYQADLSVQIEDSPTSAKSMLGDAASMFDTKTAASAEMEILRSRMVVAKAVDNLVLYITAEPKYLPLIGAWLAHRSDSLSTPRLGGRVSGNESIVVRSFDVPVVFQDRKFTLLADGEGKYTLTLSGDELSMSGKVGELSTLHTPLGDIKLLVEALNAQAGAAFNVLHGSRLKSIENLQDSVSIVEKGKQSGVIGLSLEGDDAELTARTLNEIGFEYIRQNVHRKSEEAQKTLDFLDKELPKIKLALESSETRYKNLRDTRGTIDIGAEGKGLLDQSVGLEVKLLELRQKRDELLIRYTAQHPSVVSIDGQIRILENGKLSLQGQIKKLPSLQQDMLGLERDVKVNTELYTSLLNTAQQLSLLKASKVGTARMIDVAVTPEESIKPKRKLIAIMSIFLGLFAGVATAFIRKAMMAGIDNPKVIEDATGLPVYATILESAQQEIFAKQIKAKQAGKFILAHSYPDDLSVESLRSFRVALQFAMLDASNNRVMITGASPGIGKSFIAANLSTILAQAGKRVLLLDMDLHKGHLNQYFGLPRQGGVSELLAAGKTLEEVTHRNVLANLDLITVGERVPNPSQLFLTERLPQFLEQVSACYDIVLIDAPPVLLISDVSVMGPLMGTTFLIARDGLTTVADIQASQHRLGQAQVAIKGVLFNGQLKRISSQYGYGYGYKYGNYKQNGTSQG
jgi:tyrosine-protein kinase Etk/Wzc